MHLLARHNPTAGTLDTVADLYLRPPGREMSTGRASLDNATVHMSTCGTLEASQLRGLLAVPTRRNDRVIGAINLSRSTAGPFSARLRGQGRSASSRTAAPAGPSAGPSLSFPVSG